MNSNWLIAAIAYLLGSIPFGLLIVKCRSGADIRNAGSGNIGAANVMRSAGPGAGALTLLFDAGKGWFAVWLASHWTGGNIRWMTIAAVLAVVGHVFPVWLRFKGGKGVATALGAFLPICVEAVAAAAVLWVLVALFRGYSSLASIVSVAALPVLVYVLYAPSHAPPTSLGAGALCTSFLILAKHRGNIERLIAGSENRLNSPRR